MHIVCKDLTQFKKYGIFVVLADIGTYSNPLLR